MLFVGYLIYSTILISVIFILICVKRNKSCWCFTATTVNFSWKLQSVVCISLFLEFCTLFQRVYVGNLTNVDSICNSKKVSKEKGQVLPLQVDLLMESAPLAGLSVQLSPNRTVGFQHGMKTSLMALLSKIKVSAIFLYFSCFAN